MNELHAIVANSVVSVCHCVSWKVNWSYKICWQFSTILVVFCWYNSRCLPSWWSEAVLYHSSICL